MQGKQYTPRIQPMYQLYREDKKKIISYIDNFFLLVYEKKSGIPSYLLMNMKFDNTNLWPELYPRYYK